MPYVLASGLAVVVLTQVLQFAPDVFIGEQFLVLVHALLLPARVLPVPQVYHLRSGGGGLVHSLLLVYLHRLVGHRPIELHAGLAFPLFIPVICIVSFSTILRLLSGLLLQTVFLGEKGIQAIALLILCIECQFLPSLLLCLKFLLLWFIHKIFFIRLLNGYSLFLFVVRYCFF